MNAHTVIIVYRKLDESFHLFISTTNKTNGAVKFILIN